MKRKLIAVCLGLAVALPLCNTAVSAAGAADLLLSEHDVRALGAEISGLIARDTVAELGRYHRVQASTGYASAAEYIARKAREYGLSHVQIEHFPADGKKTYYTLKSSVGWEATRGELWETAPNRFKLADYAEMNVALADYSQDADVKADLVDVGEGTAPADYKDVDVKGKIVLAAGGVAAVHRAACDERGAAGILSYQPNQVTGWSGEYVDNVRWGHLSPYNPANKFAFMISLRTARTMRDRLRRGERISLHAIVNAQMRASNYDVVTATIPGAEFPDEEIVFSCHLCHQKPGANDNASGAAAILEVARTLQTLIARGEIAAPRRTIRFIWPPEINGTLAYLAERPDELRKIKAVVHCDMVGGDFRITRSVLHLTHTPASLPSAVNTVGDVFAEYAIQGSLKAAMDGEFQDALISPNASRESLVADITPFEMGSDHDVYEESTFKIPAIYLRDWPDVFIHTNNDTVANIEPTKIKRSSFIAAACGYFMARAGSKEASKLADEVFSRALGRIAIDYKAALEAEARGGPDGAEEGRNIITTSLEMAAAELASCRMFAEADKTLESKVDGMVDQLSGTWLVLTGQLSQQKKGKKTLLVLEPRDLPVTAPKEPPKNKNAKEASRPRTASGARLVPVRKVKGPMNIYYYDYVLDHSTAGDLAILDRFNQMPDGGKMTYEILNLVDGARSIKAIRDYITAAYHPIALDDVADYLRLLDKIGVVELTEK